MTLDLVCKTAEEPATASAKAEPGVKDDPVILCRNCRNAVTKPEFRISVANGFSHTFANPAGHVFEIGCFSRADGCTAASPPSSEFSWFKGYVWHVGICRHCQAQLGWIFSSSTGTGRAGFFGLILDQLIVP